LKCKLLAAGLSLVALSANAANVLTGDIKFAPDRYGYSQGAPTFPSETQVYPLTGPGTPISGSCPDVPGPQIVCLWATGHFNALPNGVGIPVTNTTVTNGSGWLPDPFGCWNVSDINFSYMALQSDTAGVNVRMSCYPKH
jgi:hypothetical protein